MPISKVFFSYSGSEANDTQVKLAWYMNNALGRPRKKKIIGRAARLSRRHGRRGLADRPAGQPRRLRPADRRASCIPPARTTIDSREPGETEEAFARRLAAELEALILREGPDTVAAFIAEPVMGAGGAIIPPAGYFAKIQAVLEQLRRVLIADEVICGFGRLGTWFGCEALGMRPDTIRSPRRSPPATCRSAASWCRRRCTRRSRT